MLRPAGGYIQKVTYDAILILGGGVRDGGQLPPWAAARFDLARSTQPAGPFVCLSAGTPHRPPPIEHGFPISEAAAGARYLMSAGVPHERIRMEATSLDTVGNAWFSKLLHVDPSGWSRLLVITSEFHMPRAQAVFEWVYGFEPDQYGLSFAAAPNVGLTPETLRNRIGKERDGLEAFARTRSSLHTLRDVHQWIWTAHLAYSAAGLLRGARAEAPELLDSY